MNDYFSRGEIPPIDRVPVRPVVAVPAVQPAAQAGTDLDPALRQARAQLKEGSGEGADLSSTSEEQLASAAEYARVHARIADIIADLRSGRPGQNEATAQANEQAITSLLPSPIVIIPLPPASRDMVEHAVRVAKDMADQAAYAHAAQAHLKMGTVDQILTTEG